MNVFFLAFVLQVRADDLGLDGAKEANRKAEEAHMSFHIGSPSTVGLVRWLQCGRFLFPGILSMVGRSPIDCSDSVRDGQDSTSILAGGSRIVGVVKPGL